MPTNLRIQKSMNMGRLLIVLVGAISGLLIFAGCAVGNALPTDAPTVANATNTQQQVAIEQTLAALDQTATIDSNQAIPIAITKAKIAIEATNAAATAIPNPTRGPATPTPIPQIDSTVTPDKVQVVLTANAAKRTQAVAQKNEYQNIDFREIRDFPSRHIGEKVIVKGKIFNVEDAAFQMYFDGTSDAVVVRLHNFLPSGIYRDSSVVVYGTVAGIFEGKNTLGNPISQPLIEDAYLLIDGNLK